MPLINCPECGKEVSDTAISCPNCGYSVNKYVEGSKKQERIQESVVANTSSKKSSKIGIVIAVVAILVIAVIIIFVVKQNKRNEEAKQNVKVLVSLTEDISEYREQAIMKLDDGSYMYYDAGADYAISEIYKTLTHLYSCVEYIDEHYSESPTVFDEAIYKGTNYGCKTWEEYKNRLNTNYHLDEDLTDMERAEVIVSWYVDFNID